MASPQAEAAKAQMIAFREAALGAAGAQPTLEEMRAGAELVSDNTAEPDGVSYEMADLDGGLRAMWVIPDGAVEDRVIQYVHGGGYVICSIDSHRKMVGHLAKAAGMRALNVDYRMAPEHPHPAPVNDSVAAYQWLLARGFAPSKIAISGDSAGGGLTLATLLALRDRGLPQPACAVPISPWTDMEGLGESMTLNADKDLIVQAEPIKLMAELFLQGQDARDPLAAPLYGDYHGIAPLYIQVGGDETLLDDSIRVAGVAARAGVDVRLDVFPEMQHVFQQMAGNMPEADDAIARAGAYIDGRLG